MMEFSELSWTVFLMAFVFGHAERFGVNAQGNVTDVVESNASYTQTTSSWAKNETLISTQDVNNSTLTESKTPGINSTTTLATSTTALSTTNARSTANFATTASAIVSTTTQIFTTSFSSSSTKTTTKATCATGYILVNGSCQDINECAENNLTCPEKEIYNCHNLLGSYICACSNGTVRRKLDENFNVNNREITKTQDGRVCIYAVLAAQQINAHALVNTTASNVTSTLYTLWQNTAFAESIWPEIVGVNIIRFNQRSLTVTYEILNYDGGLRVDQIQRYFRNAVKKGVWNKTGSVYANDPSPAPIQCQSEVMHSLKVTGRSYRFLVSQIGQTATSKEKCSDAGYSATVRCTERQGFGEATSGFFNSTTLRESFCNSSVRNIMQHVQGLSFTSDTLEQVTNMMYHAWETRGSSITTEEMKTCVQIIKIMEDAIVNNGTEVTTTCLTYLMWLTDAMYDTVQAADTENTESLNIDERATIISAMDVFAKHVVIEATEVIYNSSSKVFQARKLNCSHPQTFVFNESLSDPDFDRRVSSSIPASAIPRNCNTTINALFYIHKDITFFPPPTKKNHKVNQILSSQLSGTTLQGLQDPISQSFSQPKRLPGTDKDFITHRCAYLDMDTLQWKYDGCKTKVIHKNLTTCDCDHTTNFAVIVQTHAVLNSYAINTIGYIGCSLSTFCLILLLIIYLYFKKLRTNPIMQLHVHLSFCLVAAYLTFVTGVQRPRLYVPCLIVGAVLQFSLLSAWGWMVGECFTMHKKFVRVFSTISSNYVAKMSAIVYGLSISTTAITMIVSLVTGDLVEFNNWDMAADNDPDFYPSYYVSDRMCWLHSKALYFGFFLPVGIMLLVNIFGFARITAVLMKTNDNLRSTKIQKTELKDHAYRVITVSVILGISWVFAIPLTLTDDPTVNEIFSWLFSIANAFQGVFIFLLFCVKRKDVRILWAPIFSKFWERNSYDLQKQHGLPIGTTGTASTNIHSSEAISVVTYKSLVESRGGTPVTQKKFEENAVIEESNTHTQQSNDHSLASSNPNESNA